MNSRQKVIESAEKKDIDIMETIAGIMQQQAEALAEMAKTSLTNSKAMEKLAETQHIQALAVDKIVNNFENIGTSLYDIRNAITSVDDTLKGYYSASVMEQRNHATINIYN